jgi:ADP-ribose pyrophosphatase YjhB (NUDIX family)
MTGYSSTTHQYGVPAAQALALAPAKDPRRRAGQPLSGKLRTSLERRDPDHGGLMPKRIDYYDDPSAPAANSMVPSVNVVIENNAGEILMIQRSDNGNWAVPGGAIDIGESMSQAGVPETKEETGIDCEVLDIIGIYTDPKHIIFYTSNGEARQEFSILLRARATGGVPTTSSESTKVRWVPRADISDLQMDRSMRRRIAHYLGPSVTPYFD